MQAQLACKPGTLNGSVSPLETSPETQQLRKGCGVRRSLAEKMNKGKKTNVKPFMVKNYLSVFIKCMIENPAFDSQVGPLDLQVSLQATPQRHVPCMLGGTMLPH